MATLTKFTVGQNNPYIGGYPGVVAIDSTLNVACNTISFAQTGGSVANADVVNAIIIPAGAYVYAVSVIVITAEGATCTASVGDTSGSNSWDASVDLNAAANTATESLPGTDAYATTGKYYSAATPISLTMSNAASTAVIKVVAKYAMV